MSLRVFGMILFYTVYMVYNYIAVKGLCDIIKSDICGKAIQKLAASVAMVITMTIIIFKYL